MRLYKNRRDYSHPQAASVAVTGFATELDCITEYYYLISFHTKYSTPMDHSFRLNVTYESI